MGHGWRWRARASREAFRGFVAADDDPAGSLDPVEQPRDLPAVAIRRKPQAASRRAAAVRPERDDRHDTAPPKVCAEGAAFKARRAQEQPRMRSPPAASSVSRSTRSSPEGRPSPPSAGALPAHRLAASLTRCGARTCARRRGARIARLRCHRLPVRRGRGSCPGHSAGSGRSSRRSVSGARPACRSRHAARSPPRSHRAGRARSSCRAPVIGWRW